MTAYTVIADSEIDPESPGTTTLFTKLRDNPIAISEGTSPAPAISITALDKVIKPLILLETVTESDAAGSYITLTTAMSSTYDEYVIQWEELEVGTTLAILSVEIGISSASYQAIAISGQMLANATNGACGQASIMQHASTAKRTVVFGQGVYVNNSAVFTNQIVAGNYSTVSATDSIRIAVSTGWVKGTARLYGRLI